MIQTGSIVDRSNLRYLKLERVWFCDALLISIEASIAAPKFRAYTGRQVVLLMSSYCAYLCYAEIIPPIRATSFRLENAVVSIVNQYWGVVEVSLRCR